MGLPVLGQLGSNRAFTAYFGLSVRAVEPEEGGGRRGLGSNVEFTESYICEMPENSKKRLEA